MKSTRGWGSNWVAVASFLLLGNAACTAGNFNQKERLGNAKKSSDSKSEGTQSGASGDDAETSILDDIASIFSPSPSLSLQSVRALKKGFCTKLTLLAEDGESESLSVTLSQNTSGSASATFYTTSNCTGSGEGLNPSVSLNKGVESGLYVYTEGTGSLQITAQASGYPDASLSVENLEEPSWTDPIEVTDAISPLTLPLNGYDAHVPQIVGLSDRALSVWIQGNDLKASVIDPSGSGSEETTEIEQAPGLIQTFHLSVDPETRQVACLTWIQDVPASNGSAVFARLYSRSSGWGTTLQLSPSSEQAIALHSAVSIHTEKGAWVVWTKSSGSVHSTWGSRLSLSDGGSVLESATELVPERTESTSRPYILLGTGPTSAANPMLVFLSNPGTGVDVFSKSAATLLAMSSETALSVFDFEYDSSPGVLKSFVCDANGSATGSLKSVCAWRTDGTKVAARVFDGAAWSASPSSALISNSFDLGPIEVKIDSSGNAFVAAAALNSSSRMRPYVAQYTAGAGWGAGGVEYGNEYTTGLLGLGMNLAGDVRLVWSDSAMLIQLNEYEASGGTWSALPGAGSATAVANASNASGVRAALLGDGTSVVLAVTSQNDRLKELRYFSHVSSETSLTEKSSFLGTLFAEAKLGMSIGLGWGKALVALFSGEGVASAVLPQLNHKQMGSVTSLTSEGWGSAERTGLDSFGGYNPQILTDDTGKLYRVTVTRIRFPISSMPIVLREFYQVKFATKEASASEWSEETILNTSSSLQSRIPSVGMKRNARGDLLVVWQNSTSLGSAFYDATSVTPSWKTDVSISSYQPTSTDESVDFFLSDTGVGTAVLRTASGGLGLATYSSSSNSWSSGSVLTSTGHVAQSDSRSTGHAGEGSTGNTLTCYQASSLLDCFYLHGSGSLTESNLLASASVYGFHVSGNSLGKYLIAFVDSGSSRIRARFAQGSGSDFVWDATSSVIGSYSLSSPQAVELYSAMDARGNAVVAWGAKESATLNPSLSDVFDLKVARYSVESGWSAEQVLDTGQGPAILIGVQMSPTGEAHVSWAQNRDSGGGRSIQTAVLR